MDTLAKKILAGAIAGCVAGIVLDVRAWSKSEGRYDWGIAFKSWVAGAVSGAAAGAGISVVE